MTADLNRYRLPIVHQAQPADTPVDAGTPPTPIQRSRCDHPREPPTSSSCWSTTWGSAHPAHSEDRARCPWPTE